MTVLDRLARIIPALVGALALAGCAGLLMTNLALGVVTHGRQIRFWAHPEFAPLTGVTERTEKRRLTLQSALDGSFQAVYARGLGTRLPIFTFAVRVRNQLMFSLFGVSATQAVLVGAHRELVERAYTDDYCSRDLASFLPEARVWAGRIRAMQDVVERQRKAFLYVVTPSKVGQYPGFMPPDMPCPSANADRVGLVPAWLALVRAAGVHVVDTTTVITQAHGRYPFALYPVGGTHWNAVGGALAAQAVVDGLAKLRPGFSPFGFTWHMTDTPTGVDIDLASLMNLLWWPDAQPVPEVTEHPGATPATCDGRRVVIVGGSFGHAIAEHLSEQPCRPYVTEYEYWRLVALTWHDGTMAQTPFDEAQRGRDLADADVILYEDNEQMLGRSLHGKALYDYLMAER